MNPLRQGFSWWCFTGRGHDPEALLTGAAEIGYVAVDLIDEPLWPLALERGLQISAINGHSMGLGLNRREDAPAIEAEIQRNLLKAEKWQIPQLICFVGNREGLDDQTGLNICAETLTKLAPQAAAAGVTLAVELFNSKVDHPDYQGDHTSFGVRLCQAVDAAAVRILYDIYHMQIMDGDIIRTINEYHRWFCHYHTAGNPGRGQPDATQELNYPAIYRAIAATGYKGFVSHEFVPSIDPLEALALAFRDGTHLDAVPVPETYLR
jgi:hydroxypyruvate isomerase